MTWPLTPWYPATTKPARPGIYLCTQTWMTAVHVLHWGGRKWRHLDGVPALQWIDEAVWSGSSGDRTT
jgi:hypothetical protein